MQDPIIEVVGIGKTFGQGDSMTSALSDVSFKIFPGEFVAIMGPSGSGKSTLLHILGFLDSVTSGTYRFKGKDVGGYSPAEVARIRNKELGFIFQSFNLLPRISVLENIELPLHYSDVPRRLWNERAQKAAEAVGLSHRMNAFPTTLSGGEKQRVAIARALVNGPTVIFADEPTGNLDSKSGKVVMEIIRKLNDEGHTVILITHETYTAENAKRIIRLHDGHVESDEVVLHRASLDGYTK
jgi:putative ABC transport system ATP-binding protein